MNVEVAGAHGTTGGGGTVHTTPVTTTALNRATDTTSSWTVTAASARAMRPAAATLAATHVAPGCSPSTVAPRMRATVSLPVMKLTSAVTSKSETVSRPSPPNEAAADHVGSLVSARRVVAPTRGRRHATDALQPGVRDAHRH